MKRALSLIVIVALLPACAGSSRPGIGTPAVTEKSTGTPSPSALSTPVPAETAAAISTRAAANETAVATQAIVVQQTVRSCMEPALPDDATVAAHRLDACLNRGEGGFVVAAATGPMPAVIVELVSAPGQCRAYDFILWRTDRDWKAQYVTPQLPDPVDDRLLGPAGFGEKVAAAALARVVSDPEGTLMAVLSSTASCGSGPTMYPILFALHDRAWQLAWDPRGSELATLSDSRADFADAAGVERVHIRGELWDVVGDPAGKICYESHPGPHRFQDQTWTRNGDRYVLSSSSVEPSAYNTLVNFIYRLSTGDDAGAGQLMADPSRLDTAKRLGLPQQPLGQMWTTNLDANTVCCGPIHILSGPLWRGGPPQAVVVTFLQRGGDWLIAGVATE
jgi:hypothetical protein